MIYPELVGYQVNGNDNADPPEFPFKCPNCSARLTQLENLGLTAYASYACGGGYKRKRQIQNHTKVWWGSCDKVVDKG